MNKKQYIFLAIGLCCFIRSLDAQTIERQIFSTRGQSYDVGLQVDYTIGEAITSTYQGAFHLTQGFQQGEFQTSPLAVSSLFLKGKRINQQKVELTWAMPFFDDNPMFIIERKLATESDFYKIGTTDDDDLENWTYLDENPSTELSYYRLKRKNNATYSNIITVEGIPMNDVCRLMPNPVQDDIQLYIHPDERSSFNQLTFYIVDALGRKMMTQSLPIGEEHYIISGFADLPLGMYFAVLKNKEKMVQQWHLVKR